MRAASSTASSRLAASTSQKPPNTSLVSANGPSVISVRPPATCTQVAVSAGCSCTALTAAASSASAANSALTAARSASGSAS